MIEKSVVIDILEDIQQCLNQENWQNKTLSSAKQYKKGILVSIDDELKDLTRKRIKKCRKCVRRIRKNISIRYFF